MGEYLVYTKGIVVDVISTLNQKQKHHEEEYNTDSFLEYLNSIGFKDSNHLKEYRDYRGGFIIIGQGGEDNLKNNDIGIMTVIFGYTYYYYQIDGGNISFKNDSKDLARMSSFMEPKNIIPSFSDTLIKEFNKYFINEGELEVKKHDIVLNTFTTNAVTLFV